MELWSWACRVVQKRSFGIVGVWSFGIVGVWSCGVVELWAFGVDNVWAHAYYAKTALGGRVGLCS